MIFENVCMSIMSRPPLSVFPVNVFLFIFSDLLLQRNLKNNEFSVLRYSLGLNVFCIMYVTFGKRTDLITMIWLSILISCYLETMCHLV